MREQAASVACQSPHNCLPPKRRVPQKAIWIDEGRTHEADDDNGGTTLTPVRRPSVSRLGTLHHARPKWRRLLASGSKLVGRNSFIAPLGINPDRSEFGEAEWR